MSITDTQAITSETILESLREIFPHIQKQYQINQLGLFGSYVRGEATETSDIDLLVEFSPDINFGLITYCKLENYLSERLGKKVDLVTKDGLKPYIGQQILQEVVYL
ncbi:nucleotidyltransferase family protein [Roseofilum sp. Guam]|uniref:nucleotidyltransferase family protein n=1 Tax=Roseofilum sp. Guam TaxID=2821502 RepID=UPI001B271D00|nr:nucleotidyltransferase family protein [Roseofilum sp. Guam]MBP0028200.1 nucleotidyltransferase family protein [Roseofilum sp. Guam]